MQASPVTPSGGGAKPVLLFDGECGLCQRVVRGLRWCDRAGRLRFAPLQSPPAQRFLRAHGLPTEDFDSLIFIPDWDEQDRAPLFRTDGALAAVRHCGPLGRALALLRVIPRGARDAFYRVVARWRYRVFGEAKPGALAALRSGGRILEDDA